MARLVRLLVIVALLGAAALAGYAWLVRQAPAGDGLRTVEAERGAITEKALATGQIEPRVTFRVKSKISGIVSRCHVEVGDAVRAGDPLFELTPDPTPAELVEAERRLESARAAFARADAEHRRTRNLVEQGVLARDALDRTRESFELARIEVERGEDTLELVRKGRVSRREAVLESVIRAPAAGIILARPVNPGDPVVPLTSFQAGTELATLARMDDLLFKGTVDEIDVGKLRVGMPARISVGALPDIEVRGHLVRIAPQAIERQGARVFEVELELEPPDGVTLRAGYSATADVIVREKSDIVVLPERLVHFSEDGERTWVEIPGEAPGDPPRRVDVELGLSDGLRVEIVSGLEAGDAVVERPPRDVLG
ncbi:MAG: efflux RND transporter periplasmic adaptor subunit [Acidobacteria bacterium]|nr:MAG: efflux RND transporter periplasmic adaptor subunit [Acidobacteriota bacterium]